MGELASSPAAGGNWPVVQPHCAYVTRGLAAVSPGGRSSRRAAHLHCCGKAAPASRLMQADDTAAHTGGWVSVSRSGGSPAEEQHKCTPEALVSDD